MPVKGGKRVARVTLADMAADTPAGLCPLCHDELPPPKPNHRKRVYCGAPECVTAYQRLYRRAYRDAGRDRDYHPSS